MQECICVLASNGSTSIISTISIAITACLRPFFLFSFSATLVLCFLRFLIEKWMKLMSIFTQVYDDGDRKAGRQARRLVFSGSVLVSSSTASLCRFVLPIGLAEALASEKRWQALGNSHDGVGNESNNNNGKSNGQKTKACSCSSAMLRQEDTFDNSQRRAASLVCC